MTLIHLHLNQFNHFNTCPVDVLEEEIARIAIRLRLQNRQTEEERRQYQDDLDHLSALRYISRLRKGQLSREDFWQKVELTA